MDVATSWRATRQGSKSAARWGVDTWRAEAARRRRLRAERMPLVRDARRALHVARKEDPQRVRGISHRAERELRQARRRVPDRLSVFVLKAAAAAAAAGYVGLPLVPAPVWGEVRLWGAVAVAAAAAGGWVAVAVRRRRARGRLVPTADERRIMARLRPAHWREHCEGRGLKGTLTARPQLTASGITVSVRLDGTWTPGKLRAAEDNIRALVGCRTDLRMEIRAGGRGGWADLTLRTRSAADGDDLRWSAERSTFGVDTVTGEQVTIPLGQRMLIAGRSGAGKSIASRPLLFDASECDKCALVIIDLKRVEGRLWDHRARVASTPADVLAVVGELVAEMDARLDVLPKGQATWTPTAERPRITVVVDEGAEVMTSVKRALDGLETLARMGRAACIDVVWMTQKPTIDDGIPKQIAPQLATKICLAVSTPAEARVVLGEDAQAKGWTADELPAPGVALVRDGKRKPHPVRVRHMTDAQVIALPARRIWHGTTPDGTGGPTLTLVKPSVPGPRTPTDARVLDAVQAAGGPVRQSDVVTRSGLPKGTVSKVVRRLVDAGHLVRLADGALRLADATAGQGA